MNMRVAKASAGAAFGCRLHWLQTALGAHAVFSLVLNLLLGENKRQFISELHGVFTDFLSTYKVFYL